MKITRQWIDSVSDKRGLTIGQQTLLKKWANEPIVGATIPDHIADFIVKCKGYRNMPEEIRYMLDLEKQTEVQP